MILRYSLLRRAAYWTIDWLRGSPVRRHMRDIRSHIEGGQGSEIAAHRGQKLLEHALATVPYYQQYRGVKRIADLPVLQKPTIIGHSADFISQAYSIAELSPKSTSGSYGTPLTFYHSRDKRWRMQAELIYFSAWAGYRIGDRNVKISIRPKSSIHLFLQNETHIVPSHLNDGWLAEQRLRLMQGREEIIISSPHLVAELAEYCLAQGDTAKDFAVRGIISAGESLPESARSRISEFFGCLVLSRYAAEELGVLAQECPEQQRHHLNTSSYLIEILDRDIDHPVEPGEVGRIVVTDLYSYAMPLIRYDTGDLGSYALACDCGRPGLVLNSLEGRIAEEIIDAQGRRISPTAIILRINDLSNIRQYRFIQTGEATYELYLCTLPSFQGEAILRETLLELLGAQASLRLVYVDEIPPLPSGKRAYIINAWRSPQRRDPA
jgi:phenylacetate-CoA ligase